ncbi:MAG TPA: mechanosensitive ion channel protein MscS [Peptococcaceae bacterium]|nr:mechanosensitive ion channel protein MscS [Peptococcaceae bacterium]
MDLNFLEILEIPEVITALRIAIIILFAAGIGKIGTRLVDNIIEPNRLAGRWDERRVNTLSGLAKSMLKYSIYFVGGVMVLDELGVPTTSILAGAGVLGLAVGFGAQNLVRDVLSGFFILFEDQFAVGDYVKIAGAEGTVQEIGLRVTRVQIWTGEIHIIPNGLIDHVVNYSRSGMGVVLEVAVALEVDLDRAIDIINNICHEVAEERSDQVVDEPQVLGVTRLDSSGATIQIFGKVNPMQQWSFGRELRKRIKEAFDQEGIEIPYPHRVLINKQEKGEQEDETEEL